MFRPSIQKTRFLILIALINIGLFYIVSNSILTQKTANHYEKITAATNMQESLNLLKRYTYDEDIKNKLIIASGRDPFNTRLIFGNSESSPLVTDLGKHEAKATVLKPNFAALVVNEFEKAGLQKGDTVAISMTGSMPGANIAVLMACEAMSLHYVSISSLGASTSGATDMNLSWPKMEKILYDNNMIVHTSDKFTYGGRADYLKKGSSYRKLYGGAIKRTVLDSLMMTIYPEKSLGDLFLLHGLSSKDIANDSSAVILKTSIKNRINLYEDTCEKLSCYKAYINIGGGVASFGYKGKKKMKDYYGFVDAGILKDVLPSSKSRNPSVMIKFSESNVPIINFIEIERLIKSNSSKDNESASIAYFNQSFPEDLDLVGNGVWDEESYKWSEDLDVQAEDFTDMNGDQVWNNGEPFIDRDGMIDIGKGNLYYTKKFNMFIVWVAFLISASITMYVGFISYKQINKRMRDYNPDE